MGRNSFVAVISCLHHGGWSHDESDPVHDTSWYVSCIHACMCRAVSHTVAPIVILLDSEGHRILAKYFQPLGAANNDTTSAGAPVPALPAGLAPLASKNPYQTTKQQRIFEQGIWDKARRASGKKEKAGAGTDADTDTGRVGTPTDISGDLFQFDGNLVLFKSSYDVYLFVVAPDRENELMIHHFLQSLYDTLTILLQSQIDKRTVLDNLDLVTIAIDESVDDGYVYAVF